MWAFSSSQVTVYAIQPGRGFEQAAEVLGADFDGFLVRDGWSIYGQFVGPHISCLAHLLRRCREMALTAGAGGQSCHVPCKPFCSEHSNYASGAIKARSASGEWRWPRTTGSALDRTLQRRFRSPQNRRLATYVTGARCLFTF